MTCDACKAIRQTKPQRCAFRGSKFFSSENYHCRTALALMQLPPTSVLDEQSTLFVPLETSEETDGAVAFFATWYKRRGRLEQAWLLFDDKSPERPTEGAFRLVMGMRLRAIHETPTPSEVDRG